MKKVDINWYVISDKKKIITVSTAIDNNMCYWEAKKKLVHMTDKNAVP